MSCRIKVIPWSGSAARESPLHHRRRAASSSSSRRTCRRSACDFRPACRPKVQRLGPTSPCLCRAPHVKARPSGARARTSGVAVSSVARPKFYACMDDKPVDQLKINVLDLSGRGPGVKVFTCDSKKRRAHRSRRKHYSRPRRKDFERSIRYISRDQAQDLDQLRDDLQESIERVIRVSGAFVKALNNCAARSDRVKHIVRAVKEDPFHCTVQRKIVDKSIKEILDSTAVNERLPKRARDEAKEAEQERKRQARALPSWIKF